MRIYVITNMLLLTITHHCNQPPSIPPCNAMVFDSLDSSKLLGRVHHRYACGRVQRKKNEISQGYSRTKARFLFQFMHNWYQQANFILKANSKQMHSNRKKKYSGMLFCAKGSRFAAASYSGTVYFVDYHR